MLSFLLGGALENSHRILLIDDRNPENHNDDGAKGQSVTRYFTVGITAAVTKNISTFCQKCAPVFEDNSDFQ